MPPSFRHPWPDHGIAPPGGRAGRGGAGRASSAARGTARATTRGPVIRRRPDDHPSATVTTAADATAEAAASTRPAHGGVSARRTA
ncbi:hypothetical protein ACWERV_06000 [Streptomyces sp. NPDC004031]